MGGKQTYVYTLTPDDLRQSKNPHVQDFVQRKFIFVPDAATKQASLLTDLQRKTKLMGEPVDLADDTSEDELLILLAQDFRRRIKQNRELLQFPNDQDDFDLEVAKLKLRQKIKLINKTYSQDLLHFPIKVMLEANNPYNNFLLSPVVDEEDLTVRDINIALEADREIYLTIKLPGVNLIETETGSRKEIYAEILGNTEVKYKLTDAGFELVSVATNNGLIYDMFKGKNFNDIEAYQAKPYLKTGAFRPVPKPMEFQGITWKDFNDMFAVGSEQAPRKNYLKFLGFKLQDKTGDKIKAFLGFPRKGNNWNTFEYAMGGFVLSPIKNLIKLLTEFLFLAIQKTCYNALLQIKVAPLPFVIKALPIFILGLGYATAWVVKNVVKRVTSPINSFREAYKVHPILGVVSGLLSAAALAAIAFYALPVLLTTIGLSGPLVAVSKLVSTTNLSLVSAGLTVFMLAVVTPLKAAAKSFFKKDRSSLVNYNPVPNGENLDNDLLPNKVNLTDSEVLNRMKRAQSAATRPRATSSVDETPSSPSNRVNTSFKSPISAPVKITGMKKEGKEEQQNSKNNSPTNRSV